MATVEDQDVDDAETLEAENIRILEQFDEDRAAERLEVAPEDLTSFDLDTGIERSALEERLQEIDLEYLAEVEDDEDEDETATLVRAIRVARRAARGRAPAAFASTTVTFCGTGGCPTPGDPDDLVIRRGLIFRSGRYQDVNFDMSPAELARAKRLFKPVPIRIEHKDTLFDGKLGTLRSVKLSADGSELHGEAALPRWLANLIPADMPLKVSASWDRATKLLRELSLVLTPRIEGAALAAFSHSPPRPRTPMSHESESPVEYARRVNARYGGRGARAAFSATAAAPAPPAALPTIQTQVIQIPAPPSAEEDAELVARLKPHAAVAAGAIRRAIADIEGHIRRAPYGGNFFWPGAVSAHVERIARLNAMLAALESGKAYRPPTPAGVRQEQGATVARLALASGKSLGDLTTAVTGRVPFARGKADEAAGVVAGLLRSFAYHGGDVEELRARFVEAEREASAWRLEAEALESTHARLGPSLGKAVAAALESAGGPRQVASDLADARTIDATAATAAPDEEELASVDGQLKALGTSATGRAAQALQSRRRELAEAIDRRRADARARVEAEATAVVEGAANGRVSAWRTLADAVKVRPDAFAEGLGPALEGCALEALEGAGVAGLAGITL